MKEIEIKILNIDANIITKKLIHIGAKRVSIKKVIDQHFDFDDGRIKKSHEAFRLRMNGSKPEIAYKSDRKDDDNFLIVEEIETTVGDYEKMEKIISLLGLKSIMYREKKRDSFILGKIKIEIDTYPGVPSYLEIEGNKKDIEKTVKLLGFTMKDTTNMTASKVIKSYGKDPNNLRF